MPADTIHGGQPYETPCRSLLSPFSGLLPHPTYSRLLYDPGA